MVCRVGLVRGGGEGLREWNGRGLCCSRISVNTRSVSHVNRSPLRSLPASAFVRFLTDSTQLTSSISSHRYVLVIKLSPTEFIQQKIQKTGAGTYAIDGNPEKFATLGKLISSVSEASRPAGDTVLGKTKRNSTSIDVRTDVKSFDALYALPAPPLRPTTVRYTVLCPAREPHTAPCHAVWTIRYLGSTLVYDRRDITIETGKEVVKRSVIENSDARKELKSAMAKSKVRRPLRFRGWGTVLMGSSNSQCTPVLHLFCVCLQAGKRHEVLKQTTPSGALVMDENPVTIVLTPRLVRCVLTTNISCVCVQPGYRTSSSSSSHSPLPPPCGDYRVVERSTGEVLNRFFIRSIPFT